MIAEPRPQIGIGREATETLREPLDVACRNEKAGLAVAHGIAHTTDIRRHDRKPRGRGLDQADRRSLVRRGQRHDVAGREDRCDILAEAEEPAAVEHAERERPRLDLRPKWTIADEEQEGIGPFAGKLCEGGEQLVNPLDLGHPSEPTDDKGLRRKSELCAKRGSGHRTGLRAPREVEPKADHRDLAARSDAE